MFKIKIPVIFILLFSLTFNAQQKSKDKLIDENKPKLIVGIVVDQMRYDYLTRFYSKFGEGGFKLLMAGGYNCKNTHFNYIPTYTGPGHASIFSGTTPKYHGIIANDWYDKQTQSMVYCVEDTSVYTLGEKTKSASMSPHRMKTTTLSDVNRLFTQMRGKSIGVSIKDRGAILPAGHTANAAYWFSGDSGNFISSTYYMVDLPKWVKQFNSSNTVASYLKEWNTLYKIKEYTESGSDLNDFEHGFEGKSTATFPYDLKALSKTNKGFNILKSTPYGNSMLVDFAIKAIKSEGLGVDKDTDIFTLSFSSPDYIGHNFGVNSKEIEDTYIRLDRDLERFFKFLDAQVGQGNYTVFLTADHGAIHVPAYLKSVKIPAGYIDTDVLKEQLNTFMIETFEADNLIESISNNQVYLNKDLLFQLDLELDDVQEAIVNEIITYKNIAMAYTAETLLTSSFSDGIAHLLQNGYNQKRSGDVLFVEDPSFVQYSKKGSTHGSGLNYDTHVPLLFFGKGIKQGQTLSKTEITDIVPTISALLGISLTNAGVGKPLEFVLE